MAFIPRMKATTKKPEVFATVFLAADCQTSLFTSQPLSRHLKLYNQMLNLWQAEVFYMNH